MKQQVAKLQSNVTEAQERAQELKRQAEGQVERQAEEIQQLEVQLDKLEETLAAVEAPALAPDAADLLAGAVSTPGAAPAEGAGKQEGGFEQMLKMYEGEQGKEFAKVSANAAVTMYYNDLFAQLGLPPEAEQRVREILANHMAEQIQMGAQMMQRKASSDERKQYDKDMEASLRTSLSEVLNDTGMGIYDEYQEGFQDRVMRQSYDMQIGMFAPGLSQENREMVVDVLVEEMTASVEAGESPFVNQPEPGEQLDALERSRMRLSTVLDEQQMSEVDRFVEQQRNALEMFQGMMGNSEPAEIEAGAPPAAEE
jgi:hypothetical protein